MPNTTSWIYNSGNPNNLYAMNISGAQQLSNGNVLICNGPSGIFTEVITTGTTLWRYVNPINTTGIISQGTTTTQNTVFRCSFYPSNYSGFTAHTLTAGTTIENTNTVSATCSLTLANSIVDFTEEIQFYPNPVKDNLYIDFGNLDSSKLIIQFFNSLGQLVYSNEAENNEMIISLADFSNGIYFVIINEEAKSKTYKVVIDK